MSNYKEEIENIISQVPKIPTSRNYWLVRTFSGKEYETFLNDGIVGIGWPEISIFDIQQTTQLGKEHLYQKIQKVFPENRRGKYIGNVLFKFAFDIKKGDVVVIPSTGSDNVAFGIVKRTQIIPVANGENPNSLFNKGKEINWVLTKPRHELDPGLQKLLFVRSTLANAENYGSYIDRTMYDFFIKGEKAHTIFDVTSEEKLLASDFAFFLKSMVDLSKEFESIVPEKFSEKDLELRTTVNSPGTIELITIGMFIAVVLASAVVFLAGGNIEYKIGKTILKSRSRGIFKAIEGILENKNKSKERMKMLEIIDKHGILPPNVIENILLPSKKKSEEEE